MESLTRLLTLLVGIFGLALKAITTLPPSGRRIALLLCGLLLLTLLSLAGAAISADCANAGIGSIVACMKWTLGLEPGLSR